MSMRVLAAAFDDAAAARSVVDELRNRYRLRPTDVSMAPLSTSEPRTRQTVVAGRFADEAIPDIRAFVARRGGEVVSDVDEQWTHSPFAQEPLETPDPGVDGPTH